MQKVGYLIMRNGETTTSHTENNRSLYGKRETDRLPLSEWSRNLLEEEPLPWSPEVKAFAKALGIDDEGLARRK